MEQYAVLLVEAAHKNTARIEKAVRAYMAQKEEMTAGEVVLCYDRLEEMLSRHGKIDSIGGQCRLGYISSEEAAKQLVAFL